MDSKELTIRLAEEKSRFLNLDPGDLRRLSYYLLFLCHIVLENTLDDDSMSQDASDFEDLNFFLSKEILEPTLDVFLGKLKSFKELHVRFRAPESKEKFPKEFACRV